MKQQQQQVAACTADLALSLRKQLWILPPEAVLDDVAVQHTWLQPLPLLCPPILCLAHVLHPLPYHHRALHSRDAIFLAAVQL